MRALCFKPANPPIDGSSDAIGGGAVGLREMGAESVSFALPPVPGFDSGVDSRLSPFLFMSAKIPRPDGSLVDAAWQAAQAVPCSI